MALANPRCFNKRRNDNLLYHPSSCPHGLRPPKVPRLNEYLLPADLPRASHWNGKCCCIFSSLPDDLMVFSVFSYFGPAELCRISPTCVRWRALATDTVLWEELDLSSTALKLSPPKKSVQSNQFNSFIGSFFDSVFLWILQKFGNPMMRSLKLCGRRNLSTRSLMVTGALAPNLREIHFCNITVVDDVVVYALVTHCRLLEIVSLKGCFRVSSQALQALGKRSPKLKSLNLHRCHQLTDSAVENLGPDLEHVNLSGCHRLTDAALISLSKKCPSLMSLNLHGVHIGDQGIISLTEGCRKIEVLDLSVGNPSGGFSSITDVSLRALALCSNLRVLDIRGSSHVTDHGLKSLFSAAIHLTKLNIGGCVNASIKSLSVLACPVKEYSLMLDKPASAPLTHLSMCQLPNVSDDCMNLLSSQLSNLQSLDIHGCVSLTNDTLVGIQAGFTALKSLDIGICAKLGSEAISELRQARPNLKIVE